MKPDDAMSALKKVQDAGLSFTRTTQKGNLLQVFVAEAAIHREKLDKIANALPGCFVTAKGSTIEIMTER